MYLKSLVLKGFKSFADRSVLTLQPGITAIVGPNGSGKSNISDAVLWVLGERSARNLRGQAMEDIIFSGSAARKAVSVAEVDLVLDNSDHVLPVDYDEVAITRRMYRSGESEYLVNGIVARRLDVLDILHDSGLGTGTHSIISQGSLDSILQSKPEDRRALIEEAAGVLKHKRRKEKSARKLELMENNLERVRDLTNEVARQMGPLERKAKRAEAYRKASAELAEVKLALAVDDLRKLQQRWDEVCVAEKAVADEVGAQRDAVQAAERAVNEIQELMKRESEDASTIARKQRRASNLSERLDSAEMLLRERRRAAESSRADLLSSLEGSALRREAALAELAGAKSQLAEVSVSSASADALVAELAGQRDGVEARRRGVESEISGLSRQLSACERELESSRRRQASLRESLASGKAQVKIVEARRAEFESELARAREDHEACRTALAQAKLSLDELAQRESDARKGLLERFEARDEAHAARDDAHKEVRLAQAEIEALEKALSASLADDPARSWLVEHAERFGGNLVSVSKAFRVTRGLESLVERLLGYDLAALSVDDAECARSIADALIEGKLPGDVSIVMLADTAAHRALQVYDGSEGHLLIDELSYPENMGPVLEALLGDVVLCPSRAEAFAGHKRAAGQWRFVSRDGCAIWPSGKVRVFGENEGQPEGVIVRERRLDEMKQALVGLLARRDEADAAAQAADEAYRILQAESLALSQQLANSKGNYDSASADEQRAARRVQAVVRDMEQAEAQVAAANKEVGQIQPTLDELEEGIAGLEERRKGLLGKRRARNDEVAPLRREADALSERYSEARLEAATLSERKTYASRLVQARERDVEVLDETAGQARVQVAVKTASIERAEGALALFESLTTNITRRVRLLDEALSLSESNASSVHADVAAARDEARRAHDLYDSASSRMAQVRVDKSRLEVLVETAVKVIVEDLGTPIDHIQDFPELVDRRQAEDDTARLERKIKNMGTINPDAAEEYAQVKERYDYLSSQLADMESARKSLERIVKVIDKRMRDDFLRTYEEVNASFGEIFSVLFPGGTAHLSFDDPDKIETTGVEVTAQPRGKRLTKMMLMSGGEKSLTALALLFAVYKTRATPFYILDEVEAALDDTNLRRLGSYVETLRDSTQLIMITHQRRTMEMADVLFGVSMQADGVTKVVSQRLERALENAE